MSRSQQLHQLNRQIAGCKVCELGLTRTLVVPGIGYPGARLFFLGEAPGADEDETGLPFVGRAGKMLSRMLDESSLHRNAVFVANVLKCRPPNNRVPKTEEAEACAHFLDQQLSIIRPRVIVTLGLSAYERLTGQRAKMGQVRGQWKKYEPRVSTGPTRAIPVMPTFHPSYLMRPNGRQEIQTAVTDIRRAIKRGKHDDKT